ncbi:MAG: glycosyltransferase family 4 protein [Candidatus Gastranaerophilales bacterium]|nr:glycosyltransferase family 4 protein [Candidatus Gastranaerophilales bacterium]
MKIGFYLGDIKKPQSLGELTFELSVVNEILSRDSDHEFVFYYFGKKNIFKNKENAVFKSIKYYKKPEISFSPLNFKTRKIPFYPLNYRLKKDNVDTVFFLTPYLYEHIEIPYFTIIRDVAHRVLPLFPEFSSNFIFEKAEKRLNSFLTGASKIITANELAKNDIKTLYDVIEENIISIPLPYPLWIEHTKFDDDILSKHNLSKNSFILYPAQYWAHKNHIRLILAAQIMKEQNFNLKVVFTGMDRGNKKYLLNKVKELDLEDDVLFLDYIEETELASLYKNAYALVYPSLAGIDSICALEAMYFNCPVLISNNAGYNMQLHSSALYFNPLDENDIIEKIMMLSDLAIKDDLIAKGQSLIKNSTCSKYVDKLSNIGDDFYLMRQCWAHWGE